MRGKYHKYQSSIDVDQLFTRKVSKQVHIMGYHPHIQPAKGCKEFVISTVYFNSKSDLPRGIGFRMLNAR